MQRGRSDSTPLLPRERDPRRTPRDPGPRAALGPGPALLPPLPAPVPSSLPQFLHLKEEQGSSLEEGQGAAPSFLCCVVCTATPPGPPLHGCSRGHVVCPACRAGGLYSCPVCGDKNIGHRLIMAESLLATELQGVRGPCPNMEHGCSALVDLRHRSDHVQTCLFRPVRCPKAIFSSSCMYKGPYCTIQAHGRSHHGFHRGVVDLELGVISSKMFDKGVDQSSCDDSENAKFQPLELLHGEHVFYCYFERVAARQLWFFFIRHYGVEEARCQWEATVSVGAASLERHQRGLAGHVFRGRVAPYTMARDDIRQRGLMLAVPDEAMRAGKKV